MKLMNYLKSTTILRDGAHSVLTEPVVKDTRNELIDELMALMRKAMDDQHRETPDTFSVEEYEATKKDLDEAEAILRKEKPSAVLLQQMLDEIKNNPEGFYAAAGPTGLAAPTGIKNGE